MNIYLKKRQWKLYFLIFAMMIVAGSLIYTRQLTRRLTIEEGKKIKIWAEALKQLNLNPEQDVVLITKILENNSTIPVILVDDKNNIIDYHNILTPRKNIASYLQERLEVMKTEKKPILIELVNGRNYVYYSNSNLLVQLSFYPYVQLALIIIFIIIAYFTFSYAKRAEQNQVWVGMSKETAHQLGTPISSLMAWVEILKLKDIDNKLLEDIKKDVERLGIIAERFSKIGSLPTLQPCQINKILERILEYIKNRSSNKIIFKIDPIPNKNSIIPLNPELFEWVIENICKNAVDAMNGGGTLHITVTDQPNNLIIDIADTGRGIAKKNFKTVFEPGFTTKKRGWGLGLSLAKRIVENYHSGKIFVLNSEINKGTIFRIQLRKT